MNKVKKMGKSPKEEFIELISDTQMSKGLGDLPSKIIGILFIEPEEMSLDELAKRTGYSLSAVCTDMKFIERFGIVKKLKKPKSKKIYFYMEKDMISMFMDLMKKTCENNIFKIKSRVPKIIENYKLEKSKNSEKELMIIKNYYEQLFDLERIVKKLIEMLEEVQEKFRRR